MMWIKYASFGTLFGFVLSRVGATQYDAINGMFLLNDLHLMGVIGIAVLVAAIGLRLPRWLGANRSDAGFAIQSKPIKHGNIVGGLVFGAGWALSGACPGTGLAQLGEGQLSALFTVGGIFLGTWLYRRLGPDVEQAIGAAKQSLPIRSSDADRSSVSSRSARREQTGLAT